MRNRGLNAAVAGCLALALSACASAPSETRADYDPFEPMNRKMYRFNEVVDNAAVKPIAKGYRKVVPAPVRRGFANLFNNFRTPASALNNFLQGKPRRGFNELGRFLFNTTLGVGGIFDVASAGGMESYEESFSETLAVWGLPEGPYLVLPMLGPSSTLDTAGLPVDYYTDINTYLRAGIKDRLYLFRLVDKRARLLSANCPVFPRSGSSSFAAVHRLSTRATGPGPPNPPFPHPTGRPRHRRDAETPPRPPAGCDRHWRKTVRRSARTGRRRGP
jgi:phospholipid-binding lipoprotein MlaA